MPDFLPELKIPPGYPDWITEELLRETMELWSLCGKDCLTLSDALEILSNMGGALRIIREDAI